MYNIYYCSRKYVVVSDGWGSQTPSMENLIASRRGADGELDRDGTIIVRMGMTNMLGRTRGGTGEC